MAGVGEGAAAAKDLKMARRTKPVSLRPQETLDMPHSVEKPRNLNLHACGVEASISDWRQAPVRAYLVCNSATSCLTKLLSRSIFLT